MRQPRHLIQQHDRSPIIQHFIERLKRSKPILGSWNILLGLKRKLLGKGLQFGIVVHAFVRTFTLNLDKTRI